MTADLETPSTGRSALLLGATGLVGSHCLDLLLADDSYERVRVLARRPVPRRSPKLETHRVDFEDLGSHAAYFAVDDIFCCLGTTMARAGSEAAFRRVDYDYPLQAAELAVAEGAEQFLMVSAVGADPQSRIFYNRVKGEAEAAVKRLPFRAVWVLRPSLLLGEREEFRVGERLAAAVARPLAPLMIGRLRRYRPITARDVAVAMLRLAHQGGTGGVVESEEIAELAAQGREG
ncbi:MAG TPA: oxidoreductase [Longimicrobiaceae bacterium]